MGNEPLMSLPEEVADVVFVYRFDIKTKPCGPGIEYGPEVDNTEKRTLAEAIPGATWAGDGHPLFIRIPTEKEEREEFQVILSILREKRNSTTEVVEVTRDALENISEVSEFSKRHPRNRVLLASSGPAMLTYSNPLPTSSSSSPRVLSFENRDKQSRGVL